MEAKVLFGVPILSSPNSKVTGTIVCSCPAPQVYLLTFAAPPDNRLVTSFCKSFLLALDIIEFSYPSGVVVTTSAIGKFYSNGLDLQHASSTEGYWTDSLYKVFRRLLTYVCP
jgi:Delta3-Delta2-enoyl-CoA isomerase